MLGIIHRLFSKQRPNPLGRWRNVGDQFSHEQEIRSQRQKQFRTILKKYSIDPYALIMDSKQCWHISKIRRMRT